MSKKVLGPSDPEYWDQEFYIDGEGKGQIYEWYTGFETLNSIIKPYFHAGDYVMHVGAGNSTLAELILSNSDFPDAMRFVNTDISENIIDRMNERLDNLFQCMENPRAAKEALALLPPQFREAVLDGRRFSRDQISYQVADCSNMPEFEDGSVDLVLDKGLLDAALSHGEVDTGEDPIVQKILQEIHRVLKPNGKYLVVSGNDSFITMPYFVGDESVEWEVEERPIVSERQKGQKAARTVFFYVLTALKD